MLKIAEMEEETPDETLDMFEERLEALSAEARGRIATAGEGVPEGDFIMTAAGEVDSGMALEPVLAETPEESVPAAPEEAPGAEVPVEDIPAEVVEADEEEASTDEGNGDEEEPGEDEAELEEADEPLLTVAGAVADEEGLDLDETGKAADQAWHGWRKSSSEDREPDGDLPDEEGDE
jgi:hypothetical protein